MDTASDKKYSNGEVTVYWQPHKCIHATTCFKGLPDVFDPGKRPWVDIYGAFTDEIIDQVKQCPSGALSYHMNAQPEQSGETPDSAGVIIDLMPDGPMIVRGSFTLRHPDGTTERYTHVNSLCRCGHSASTPFCDGSHYGTGFTGK